jgi:hypothetical protein
MLMALAVVPAFAAPVGPINAGAIYRIDRPVAETGTQPNPIIPAVLEIRLPAGAAHATQNHAPDPVAATPAQWISGPLPLRCRRAVHSCLVI